MEKRGAGKWRDGRKDDFIFLYCSHYLKRRSVARSSFMIFFYFYFYFLKGEEGRNSVMPSISLSEEKTFLKK